MKSVLLIGTLDTKGPEIAYVRDRLQSLGLRTIVADSGISPGCRNRETSCHTTSRAGS